LQQQYNLVRRDIELEVIPAALHNQIGLLPWSPLASGFLSGKYGRDHNPGAGTRLGKDDAMYRHIGNEIFGSPKNWATLDVVKTVAEQAAATPSQVALSWLANQPAVTSVIIGARTMAQLVDNLAAAELRLGAEAIAQLDAVSAPTPDDYPYGRFGVLQRGRYLDSSDQALRELAT
jgi:aryl-alcohol dehydrogenase-like predicted oxidoreductase